MATTTTTELACLDGVTTAAAEATIPVVDEGFIRGDGVFEVIRVYDGRPYKLAEHLDRLERSAANLRLGWDVPRAKLEEESAALLSDRGGSEFDGALRLVLTRGGRRLLLTEQVPSGPPAGARVGFVTFAPTRILDGVKSLSYAANMLAGRLARERGFDEALLVTPHGRVLEAPTASVFWVDERGDLCTPPLEDHILASITRQRVMALTEVRECHATTDDLLAAREAFLASTLREVGPVRAVEDRELPAVPGPRTSEAAALLREDIRSSLG
ncbi:MAG: branched-chain amino acid aminotransferase [Thermoleophilaceae bacterium]|jgi:branched-chain amino acid aminotransferase|nr:branched-chain amino acid aminotransferase [Thermoleophilaceae bacterium]